MAVPGALLVLSLSSVGGCTKSAPGADDLASIGHGRFGKARVVGERAARIARAETDPFDDTPELVRGQWRREHACPREMANVEDRFCVDRWEDSLVEILPNGEERPFSPFQVVGKHVVRAVSVPHVDPQGYISETQAKEACARSGKRLCKPAEWRQACMGPQHTTFGYGSVRVKHRCNDSGDSPMLSVLHMRVDKPWTWTLGVMNDPRLNQAPDTLSRTGSHEKCTNGYGVYDMVGNLHEWVDDPKGSFQGGYYLDTHINGDGCNYRTVAHAPRYHDYSTGFRCCAAAE